MESISSRFTTVGCSCSNSCFEILWSSCGKRIIPEPWCRLQRLERKFFLRERPFQTQCFYRCGGFTLKIQHLVFIYECDVWQVCCDDTLGRHLVATRDIKQGEVVLREAPLLQGPSQVTGPVCLGCLQGISQHNSEPCDKCGWPLCRRASCREAPQHLPECRWTVDKRATPVSYTHRFRCTI